HSHLRQQNSRQEKHNLQLVLCSKVPLLNKLFVTAGNSITLQRRLVDSYLKCLIDSFNFDKTISSEAIKSHSLYRILVSKFYSRYCLCVPFNIRSTSFSS